MVGASGFVETWSGYFDSAQLLVQAAASLDERGATGIYFTPNPVHPALLARANNRVKRVGKADALTKNHDILRRRFLLLDLDPVRPAGISSSENEKQHALQRADDVVRLLTEAGWPEPVRAESGNGAHLLYRVDLPTDDGGLLERVTKALATRFSDEVITVDTAVHNAARIFRLYGTTARKGDPTVDRPHRRSRVLYIPEPLHVVPNGLLTAMISNLSDSGSDLNDASRTGELLDGEIRRMLSVIPRRPDYELWIRIISGVLTACGGDVIRAEALLTEWSPEERRGEYAEKLAAPLGQVGTGSLVFVAKQYGYRPAHVVDRADATPPDFRPTDHPIGVLVSEVEREPIRWLWPGRLALGKLTILDGDPGTGKSTLYCDIAARVTRGKTWPDDENRATGPLFAGAREAGGVVIVTSEDSISDTIRPRLEEAGADLTRCLVIQSIPGFSKDGGQAIEVIPAIPHHLPQIEDAAKRLGASLLIIDPLFAHLGGHVNSYRDQDVRSALAPLAVLAEKLDMSVLIVRHLNKLAGGSALYRGGGSIGVIGAARLGLLLGRDPEVPEDLVLATTKSNISRHCQSLSLRVVSSAHDAGVGVIAWKGTSSHKAEDLLAPPARLSTREKAEEWLADRLADGHPHPASKVLTEAAAAGFSESTIRRCMKDLGVASEKTGFGADGEWLWRLRFPFDNAA